jgi:hypothetical protein
VTTRTRRVIRRLRLGPVVGHTDAESARVWIQPFDDPARYALRVYGASIVPFVPTETGKLEFNTGIAVVTGLRPDWRYRYSVLRLGRWVGGAAGSFRTMPQDPSMSPVLFAAISCSRSDKEGLWERFAQFVEKAQPHFVLMMGDQIYLDEDPPDVFAEHFDSDPSIRRQAMAEKYRLNWSRDSVRQVLANTPSYMMWDDHDIRDGWGSSAADSPTLLARYPRGSSIFEKSVAYFEDARDVYWHFQGCHNPLPTNPVDPLLPNYIAGPAGPGARRAMPFVFRVGRMVVLVLDSRGERDTFREQLPILGAEQWQFIDTVMTSLPSDVDALAVVTPTPIASADPDGQMMKLLGSRTDDVDAFKRGDLAGVFHPYEAKGWDQVGEFLLAALGARLTRLTGSPVNIGAFKLSAIDEVRDQWSHKASRPEQVDLLRKAGLARLSNRSAGNPRALLFLSGDIHHGAIFDLAIQKPRYRASSLTSSGISAKVNDRPTVGVFVDDDFSVGPGMRSTLRDVVPDFNYGVVQMIPAGTGATFQGAVEHAGAATAYGLDLADLL